MNYTSPVHKLIRYLSKGENQEQDAANINMIGDYSSIPTTFQLKPLNDVVYRIKTIHLLIADSGVIEDNEYVSTGPLSNGITVSIKSDLVDDITFPLPIKDVRTYGTYGADINLIGTSKNSWAIHWRFENSFDLSAGRGESLAFSLNDNFSTLSLHTAFCLGDIDFVN